jgi:hypothetical protein
MTIGIFGDSFGDWDVQNGLLKHISWPYLVAGELQMRCINMCKGGSSLYYSYTKFLEKSHECDVVIFLLTSPGRYTKPFQFEKLNPSTRHVNNVDSAMNLLSHKGVTSFEKKKLENLIGFYMSVDFQWELTACNLLVQEIKRIRPDVILVPCFDFYKEFVGSNVSLQDITDLQSLSLGSKTVGIDFINRYEENKIVCHFTDVSNQFVADKIINSIKNKIWTCELSEKLLHPYPLDYYYNRRN